MSAFFLFLSLLVSCEAYSQKPFEGEIDYRYSLLKKAPDFVVDSGSCLITTTKVLIKNGSLAQFSNSCDMEYDYFDRTLNQQFSKLKNKDFIGVQDYSKRTEDQDSVLSWKIEKHTDTILKKVCNRITLVTKTMRLIFIYSPDLPANPEWYRHTEGGYYNYIYSLTKAYWLKFIIETEGYTSQAVATKIIPGRVSFISLPDLSRYPQITLQ